MLLSRIVRRVPLRAGLTLACLAIFAPGARAQPIHVPAIVVHRICLDQIRLPKEIPRIGPIVPGCELVDCCPGCPGPRDLEWRIIVEGPDWLRGVELRFERFDRAELASLRVAKGRGKALDGGRILVERGETLLAGVPVPNAARRPGVVTGELSIDARGAQRAADAFDKRWDAADARAGGTPARRDTSLADMEVTVQQRLNGLVVAEGKWIVVIDRCRPPGPRPQDYITLTGNAGSDAAVVLVDGRRSGCVDDEQRRGADHIALGNLLSRGSCASEVAVFSDGNAMALVEQVGVWTNNPVDRLTVDLAPMVVVPIDAWILHGSFGVTRDRFETDFARAVQLFDQMNCGITFEIGTINDATGDPQRNDYLDRNCSGSGSIKTDIGFTAGRINVYYVRDPDARGWWCGSSDVILVASHADNESLAHEFGHGLSLGHANDVSLPGTNIMFSGGTGRTTFTEGQCFRCNVNPRSRANTVGGRSGPTRSCSDSDDSDTCPPITLDATPN